MGEDPKTPCFSPEDAEKGRAGRLPVGSAEDVEFSDALADAEDRKAQRRAAEADRREAGREGGG